MPIFLRLFNFSRYNVNKNLHNFSERFSCSRSISFIPLKRAMNEQKFAEKDKVPDGFKLIYRAPMEFYARAAKVVSTGTAAFVGTLAAFKLVTDNKYFQIAEELNLGGLVAHDSDLYMFAGGFIAINAALMIFITKYPLRIYKKDKKYIGVYEGLLPLGMSRLHFNQGEVKESKHILNPWSLITYKIKSKYTLLLIDYFKTPSEFHEMCAQKK